MPALQRSFSTRTAYKEAEHLPLSPRIQTAHHSTPVARNRTESRLMPNARGRASGSCFGWRPTRPARGAMRASPTTCARMSVRDPCAGIGMLWLPWADDGTHWPVPQREACFWRVGRPMMAVGVDTVHVAHVIRAFREDAVVARARWPAVAVLKGCRGVIRALTRCARAQREWAVPRVKSFPGGRYYGQRPISRCDARLS